jgi:hypothetical protein
MKMDKLDQRSRVAAEDDVELALAAAEVLEAEEDPVAEESDPVVVALALGLATEMVVLTLNEAGG